MTPLEKKIFLQNVLNLHIGTTTHFKGGILTRNITYVGEDSYVIDETGGGWVSVVITLNQVVDLVYGKLEFINLDWK